MPAAMSFGLWLKQLRKAHDLSQEKLAHAVSCATITLRQIESGFAVPRGNWSSAWPTSCS